MNQAKTIAFWALVAVIAAIAIAVSLALRNLEFILLPICTAFAWLGVLPLRRLTKAFDQDGGGDAARGAARFLGVMQNFAIGVAALMLVAECYAVAKMAHLSFLEAAPTAAVARAILVVVSLLGAYLGNAKARAAFPIASVAGEGGASGGFRARRAQSWAMVVTGLLSALCAVVLPVEWALLAFFGLAGVSVAASIVATTVVSTTPGGPASPGGPAP